MKKIDLHCHTSASDGTVSPAELVDTAAQMGLAAVAVTDHDTISGHAEAAARAAELGIEFVPGIEISTKFGRAVHILGYYLDPQSPELLSALDWIVQDRDTRNAEMCRRMAADGLDISYEQMQQRFGQAIGRPHFAEMLVEMGLAESISEAFDRYVEKGRCYYVGRTILPIERAIEIIRLAGGVPVLAHPFQYRLDDSGLRELIEYCMAQGLRGMECRYSGYSEDMCAYLEALAEEYHLIKTGGSDFHGSHKPHIHLGLGDDDQPVPYEWLEKLKDAKQRS